MKILIVASYNKNRYAPFIVEQADALRKAECEVEWFGVQGKGIVGYLKAVPKLRAKIREWKPDVVHAHYGLSCLVANLATRRVSVVSTYHGSDINEPKVLPFSKVAMWLSAWNIFVSQRNVDIAKPRKHWSLVPCGVALSDDQLLSRAEARKSLGWRDDERKVLFAGAFDNAVKDPELAKAVVEYINKNIQKTNKNTENILLDINKKEGLLDTSSIPNSIDHQSACEQAPRQPNAQSCSIDSVAQTLSNNPSQKIVDSINCEKSEKNGEVELIELKGYNREEVNTLMCGANCLLMTSKTEGSPQVIKEAMACGCPIVSVDVGDVKERLNGIDGCFVVPIGDRRLEIGKLAEALEKAMGFEGKTKGRERIIADGLTNEQVAKQIIDIYNKVVNK